MPSIAEDRRRKLLVGALCAAFVLPLAGQATAQQAPAANPSPPQPRRTEIIPIENWRVTCQDGEAPNAKRACSAELQLVQSLPNQPPRTLFSWVIGMREGKPAAAMQVPTGVLIAPGVEMKVGAKAARKFAFSLCQPGFCEALVPLDEPLIRELTGAETVDVTVFAVDGRGLKFSINSKGFERVLAELRK